MDNFIAIIVVIGVILLFYAILNIKTKKEKEYETYLKESLADEFIIDPETGTKITLEEAESGHWISHDNEFLPIKEKHFSNEQINAEEALNYLRESKKYLKHDFSKQQLTVLESTKILGKYDDWNYSNPFRIELGVGFIFFPEVIFSGNKHTYYDDTYNESQIMVWLQLETHLGHYYFREKSNSEKLLDLIRNDDDINLENYECFTFEKTHSLIKLIKLLESFAGNKNLEIEVKENNLFFKNLKFVCKDDLHRFERIIKNILS